MGRGNLLNFYGGSGDEFDGYYVYDAYNEINDTYVEFDDYYRWV